MIDRRLKSKIKFSLSHYPAVALVGPRQVGKTTLARAVATGFDALHLDLEDTADYRKLANASSYLQEHERRLVIIDEIHHYPDLFKVIRTLIDDGRRRGLRSGRFLLLGSASMELMRQSSESLAGRIAHLELHPFDALEVLETELDKLWVRGGFPDSFLASTDELSHDWRTNFIAGYISREMRQFAPRISHETLFRLWVMLAHYQGKNLDSATLASSLAISKSTLSRYVDFLVDLLLVKKIYPWFTNRKKSLRKSPRIYLTDSGICHTLLNITNKENLLSHPIAGPSWEGLVVHNILSSISSHCEVHYYRSYGGAEIDLLIRRGGDKPWAIEVKRSEAPSCSRGFNQACLDVEPERAYLVYPGRERFPTRYGVEAIGLREMCQEAANYFN